MNPKTMNLTAESNPEETNSADSVMSKSHELYQEALKVLPGGISRNTIWREPHPDYVERGIGCKVIDIEGRERIDFANNMCALIHGHAHPVVIKAVQRQLEKGTAFTLASEVELRLAQHICSRSDCIDQIRFTNSGTEAVMCAIKAARAYTGRPKIAKAEGAYHGTYDYAEVSQKVAPENWGEVEQPASVPVARGTPQRALDDVVVFPFNDIDRTLAILERNTDQRAGVQLDPLPHRVGLIPATPEFVSAIRDWCDRNLSLLIFDEVITFRLAWSGAREWYSVQPDLTTLGKIIGGGFPVGAIAGKSGYMSVLDPARKDLPLPHSGTFSANPISMTAGLATMELFDRPAIKRINELGDFAHARIQAVIDESGIAACVTGFGSLLRIHLKKEPPTCYRSTWMNAAEATRMNGLVDFLYDHGFMIMNTGTIVLSTPMTKTEIDAFADCLADGLASVG